MQKPPRVAFAGTPEFAVPSLQALIESAACELVAVYTQPDRPAGRGRHLTASPIKTLARRHGLEVRQPASLNDPRAQTDLAELGADVLVVVAYGLLLPAAVLGAPRLGCLNVHASLLPRWRGAAPIERAMLAGDRETGVSIMRIEPALDSGPVLAQARCPIHEFDTAGALHDRLAVLGAQLLVATLPRWLSGELAPAPQDERAVTYASKLTRAETRLDWHEPAASLALRIRAYHPRLGAVLKLGGNEVKVWAATAIAAGHPAAPGTVVHAGPDGIDVATGDGVLRLLQIQEPGRRAVGAGDFLNAHPGILAS